MMRDINGPVANTILRAIVSVARISGVDRQKPMLVVEAIRAEDWASLTFVGQIMRSICGWTARPAPSPRPWR